MGKISETSVPRRLSFPEAAAIHTQLLIGSSFIEIQALDRLAALATANFATPTHSNAARTLFALSWRCFRSDIFSAGTSAL
jgi:hypothetical protein